MNNDSPNYVELVTPQNVKGGFKHLKRLVFVSYFLIPIVLFIVLASVVPNGFGLAFICCFLFFIIGQLLKLITWPYIDIREFEYIVDKGVMHAMFVKGKKIRIAQSGKRDLDRSITTTLAEVKLSDFTLIAPYEGEYKEKADAVANKIMCGNEGSPDLYCGFYKNEKGEDTVLFFEAFNHCLKVMRYFNREATVMKEMRF